MVKNPSIHSKRGKQDCYEIEIMDCADGSFCRFFSESRIDINDAVSDWLYSRNSVQGYSIRVKVITPFN